MTTAQEKGLRFALAIAGAVATIAFSAGFARRELDGKEDRAEHASDVRALNDALHAEQNLRILQQVRDSAWRSVMLDRLTDLACVQNPNRSYCR